MIELHTRIFCECGQRHYHMMAGDVPLSKSVKIIANCPSCGRENRAEYQFDAVFHCRKWWRPWEEHFVEKHFSKNEGGTDEEIYPRHCKCGNEILLKQRRVN